MFDSVDDDLYFKSWNFTVKMFLSFICCVSEFLGSLLHAFDFITGASLSIEITIA